MKNLQFEGRAYQEYVEWAETDKKVFKKINKLIKEIDRTPFEGEGKPEPLKYDFQGYWSRRITLEHRLIYKSEDNLIIIVSCRGHYT